MLTLRTHTFENPYKRTHARALTHMRKHVFLISSFSSSFSSSFRQRKNCRSVVSITLVLLYCSSLDHISINLEQAQFDEAWTVLEPGPGVSSNNWPAHLLFTMPDEYPPIITLQTGLQSTDWIATLIWSHTSDIHKHIVDTITTKFHNAFHISVKSTGQNMEVLVL